MAQERPPAGIRHAICLRFFGGQARRRVLARMKGWEARQAAREMARQARNELIREGSRETARLLATAELRGLRKRGEP